MKIAILQEKQNLKIAILQENALIKIAILGNGRVPFLIIRSYIK